MTNKNNLQDKNLQQVIFLTWMIHYLVGASGSDASKLNIPRDVCVCEQFKCTLKHRPSAFNENQPLLNEMSHT